MTRASEIVVGVDVGGARKGFHAVALHERTFLAKLATRDPAALADWCRSLGASAVGIDAPCRWSLTGKQRPCERELALAGLSTFATPSRTIGRAHPFYGWMRQGAELFRLLAPHYRLYDGRGMGDHPVCFETFPQAIACALAGRTLSAKHKRTDRRLVLRRAGLATEPFQTIDEIDAGLCALAARHVLAGTFKAYGEDGEGYIIVPCVQAP